MLSAEEKDTFIQYILDGNDRATAAFLTNPDYTGSMFKRLCNPQSSKYYDEDFARRYAEAIEVRGPADRERAVKVRAEERESRHLRANGFTKANHLTDEQLGDFCERVAAGEQAAYAARQLDPPTSITQIHRRAERDPEFAAAFQHAKEEGLPAYREELRAEAVRQAFAGDYRALRDQMLMHLPEAKPLSTSRHEVGLDEATMRQLVERNFGDLPAEMIDELIESVKRQEQRALPAGS